MMSTASILDYLDGLADEHPDKLLYSYLDVNGDPVESYTYASFLHRTRAIAGHLLREGRFGMGDRLLLAYPPGLEMICAFFGCVRAGLIPVPVYPPSSRGFQSALYKTVHIAKDCQAAGILTSRDYHASLKTNLARRGVSASGVDVDYISSLPWIATEDFVDTISDRLPVDSSEILFLQYTSGSTMEPKGVIVTHENILTTCPLVIDHPAPVVVSWLPQYHDMGLIGCYLYPALKGGTTYGFAPMDFIQRPILWFNAITRYRATAAAAPNFAYDYCLRAGRLSKESLQACDLSSLRVLMCAAEPVKPDTYTRFLETFQPYGLKSESFYVAYFQKPGVGIGFYGFRGAHQYAKRAEITSLQAFLGKPSGAQAIVVGEVGGSRRRGVVGRYCIEPQDRPLNEVHGSEPVRRATFQCWI